MVKVRFNGKNIDVKKGTRIQELVKDKGIIAARIDGRLKDLSTSITEDCSIELVDFSSEDGKRIYWHSTSHVMAMAVKELFPATKLAIGPAIDDGFYYDFEPQRPFSADDLRRIEKKMTEIIKKDIPFERIVMKKEAAKEFFSHRDENYKLELIDGIPDGEVSLYRNGDFVDLCLGPHLPRTRAVRAFRLLSLAGAYWRGDVNQPMLQRIYGISFPTKAELKSYLKKLEEAAKRDHRKLGAELELFSIFEEAGPGLVFWHPRGTIIKKAVEDYWTRVHLNWGYQLVSTPHIARNKLWHISGHYNYYRDKLFTLPVEKEEYVLKPMNCPGHILIYKSKVRSYKELPIRYAEMGTVYRNELSGTLHGLLRVRGFTQDDAHIFCRPDQIEDEIYDTLQLTRKILGKFGFKEYRIELSIRDPKEKDKYLGGDEEWEGAEDGLQHALHRANMNFVKAEGEAVFYGPKIDIKILDALGRKWQATTIQFDFNLPKRFEIQYMDSDGRKKEVVVIHRAIYGSLERFIGCLIEHYGGALPLWISPVQCVVLPITDKQNRYAKDVFQKCKKKGLRVEIDTRSARINYRIREHELKKVPYILIIGEREVKKRLISVRKRKRGDMGELKLKEFFKHFDAEGGED